ncbi:MAG: hypothetical protein KC729_10310, partial [Candidatus Eisenbacteria bacterium]|nr:hypothetical protein [Candidatus Eisenbacteria bacterium]
WTGGNRDDGPAYVLLMGDAHRDVRGKVTTDPSDFVPTYNRYFDRGYVNQIYDPRFSSDDFFALLDGPDDEGMDLYIGRISVGTASDAGIVVDKTISYETESDFGPWRDRVTLVADDLCQGTTPDSQFLWTHLRQTELLADTIFPMSLERDRIYLVEYGAECIYTNKPEAAAALLNSMNEGTLVVNYTGHGGETQIADERVFELSSVGSLTNANRLFLFLTASCSVGKYDVSSESLAEGLIRHGGGGAVIVFSASAVATSQGNSEVNQNFFLATFPGRDATRSRPVGEAAVNAKLNLPNGGINQRRFALHGDPAVRLLTAHEPIALDMKRVADGSALGDTLHRGVLTELRGRVLDATGETRTDFDGDAVVHVYDSALARRPLADDRSADYELSGVPIFRGTAAVHQGELAVRFQVPTALRTGDRGPAKIYVYAEDGDTDAAGSLPSLFVPEEPPPASDDQTGPELTWTLGQDGDFVPPEATISATLFDSSGVNVTSLVPSRAVVFRVEDAGEPLFAEDISARVVFGEDYRTGQLEIRLPGSLVEGHRYDAVLEASDNLNNRSALRHSFVLSGTGDSGFAFDRVFNLPNPTAGGTHFLGDLSEEAYVDVAIFTLSGRKIAHLAETRVTPDQFAGFGIAWDGHDEDGDRLANGVYLYKVTARPVSGGASRSRIQRLVVSR